MQLKPRHLFAISALALTSIVSLTPLAINNLNTNLNNSKTNYVISNNQNSKTIINPDEIFYFSQPLDQLDVWDPNSANVPPIVAPNPFNQFDQSIIDTLNKAAPTQGGINEVNLKKLQAMVKKINAIPNADQNTKTKAQALLDQAQQYISFKTFEARWLASDIPNAEKIWNDGGVADAVSAQFGGIRQFSDIKELNELKDLIKKWNGIVTNVEKISQIKAQAVKQNDLLSDQAATTASDVNQVAGDNFNTLVKIATLDFNIEQNYQLEYEIQLKAASATTQSKIIFLNDRGQWKNNSLKTNLIANVDGFGRYEKYESGGAYGSDNYPSHQDNFVFKYDQTSNQLDLFVRLKQDQVMKNITFNQQLGQPSQFGILDVQVANQKSSLGLWQNDGQANANQNLIQKPDASGQNGDDQIAKIQFFSSTYQSVRSSTKIDANPNRRLTWYQLASDQPVNFDVNIINNLTTDGRASYEVLKQYVNGLPTQQVQQISFNFDGKNPTLINDGKTQYDFFAPLKAILPTQVANLFPAISKINFTSSVKSQIAKQSIHYSDQFYLFGEVASKTNLNINNPIEATMLDPLSKIFFEAPDAYQNSTDQAKEATSTLEALEQADLKLNVINLMAQIYNLQANNDDLVNKLEFKLDLPIVKYEQRAGSIYSKIHTEVESVIINGPTLYKKLTKYWDDLAKMIKATFNHEFQGEKRYSVGQLQDAQNIFSQWMVGNFEFIPVYAEVENLINLATKIWDDDPASKDNPNPQFSQFSDIHRDQLQAIVAQLIKIQFQAIVNEFNYQQQLPLYDLFVDLFNQADVSTNRLIINDPSQIFTNQNVANGLDLITYQNNFNLTTTKQDSLTNQVSQLIKLLKYQLPETPAKRFSNPNLTISDQAITIGQSLFVNPVAIKHWNSFSASALMNWSSAQAVEIKLQQLQIFNTIFKFFGFDFSDAYVDYLNREDLSQPLKLSFKNTWKPDVLLDLTTVAQSISELINSANNQFAPAAGQSYRSNHLDNLVSGANLIRILNHTYLQLEQTTIANDLPNQPQWTNDDVQSQILSILNQIQSSVSEQAAWMKAATNISYDFATFSATLSGRDGGQKLSELANRIATKEVIMAKRILEFIDTDQVVLQRAIEIGTVVTILIAAFALATSSATALAIKSHSASWSQHRVFAIFMILALIIGVGAFTTTAAVWIPTLI